MSLQVTLKSKSSQFTYLHFNEDESEARSFCASHYPDYQVTLVELLRSDVKNLDFQEMILLEPVR